MKTTIRALSLAGFAIAAALLQAPAPAHADITPVPQAKHSVRVSITRLTVLKAMDFQKDCAQYRKLSFTPSVTTNIAPRLQPSLMNNADGVDAVYSLCASHAPYDVPQTGLDALAKSLAPLEKFGLFSVPAAGNLNTRQFTAEPGSVKIATTYAEEVDFFSQFTQKATPVLQAIPIPAAGHTGPVSLTVFFKDANDNLIKALRLDGQVSTSLKPV